MRRAQILVEAALAYYTALFMVMIILVSGGLYAQLRLGQFQTVRICESYAESPDISDVVSGEISYITGPIPAPRMTIDIGGVASFSSDASRSIRLSPLTQHPPPQFTCVSTIYLDGNFPLLGQINISNVYRYTTFRRYGGFWGDTDLRKEHLITRLPVTYYPTYFSPMFLPLTPLAGLMIRRRRAQALVEYALTAFPTLVFFVSALYEIVFLIHLAELAVLGQISVTMAAFGPNPAKVNISFSFPAGSCGAAVGEAIDCDGRSPFSVAVPNVPDIYLSGRLGTWISAH